MKEVKLGKHKVMLYNSIDELPIVRFHKYNKCLLVDAGLGSDLSAVDGHIERAVRFINGGHKQEAATEMENIRQTIYLIIQGMNPRHLAFAALVKEVDGKPCDDISDDGLQRTLDLLGDVPVKEMTAENEAVKKKIDEELTLYFPDVFDSATEKEYHDIMKRRTQAMLNAVIEGETAERTAEIERLTDELVCFTKPRTFIGKDSTEIAYDRQFDEMCIMIGQQLNTDAKKYTVSEYYSAYQYIKKQQNKQKWQNKAR